LPLPRGPDERRRGRVSLRSLKRTGSQSVRRQGGGKRPFDAAKVSFRHSPTLAAASARIDRTAAAHRERDKCRTALAPCPAPRGYSPGLSGARRRRSRDRRRLGGERARRDAAWSSPRLRRRLIADLDHPSVSSGAGGRRSSNFCIGVPATPHFISPSPIRPARSRLAMAARKTRRPSRRA
jgi:hypothetical protein